MTKIIRCTAITLFAVAVLCTSASAWPDGERSGLVLGVTGGLANVAFDSGSSSESGLGYMAGVMIGAGIGEQLILDFKYRYWYSDINDVVYHTWSWCGDIIYFPVKNNGFFLNGGFGGALALADVGGAEAKGGTLIYGGVGYEITKYVFLSVDFGLGSFADDISSRTITFSVSAVGY